MQTILPDEIRGVLDELAEASRSISRAGSSVGLPAAEARVLLGLMYSRRTQADLSRRLAMDTGLVSRTVQRLKQKGLVEPSQIAAASKGSQLLWLTSSGREKAHAAQQEE